MIKISDAELIVMQVVWQKDEVTSKEIIQEIKMAGSVWNDNTIRTLINRLIEKKVTGISKKEGKSYTYVPLITESKYKSIATKQFINLLFNGNKMAFFECVLKGCDYNAEEIIEIIRKELEK